MKSYTVVRRQRRLRRATTHYSRPGYVPPAHFHKQAERAIARSVKKHGRKHGRGAYFRKVEGLPDKEVLTARLQWQLKRALNAHDWSLNRVCQLIGANYGHVWRILNGHHACTLEMALKLCWALDIRLDDLVRPLPSEKTTREGLPNSDPGRIPGTESSDRLDILDHPDRCL